MNRHDQYNQSSSRSRRSQRPENYTADMGRSTGRTLRRNAHVQSAHFCFVFGFCFVLFPGPCLVHRQKHSVKTYDSSTIMVTECWLLFGGYYETLPEEAATSMSSLKNENLSGLLGEARNSVNSLKKRKTQWTASRSKKLNRLPQREGTSKGCHPPTPHPKNLNGLPQEERTSVEEKI